MIKRASVQKHRVEQGKGLIALAIRRTRMLFSVEARLEGMVGPPGLWRPTQEFTQRFLQQEILEPNTRVLDIGCGPLRGGLPIIKSLNPGCYVGVDVRPSVIDEAHRQVARHHLAEKNPRLFVSTTFGAEELLHTNVDVVWAFSVLFHLSDLQVSEFFSQVSRICSGRIYANVNTEITPRAGTWKEFLFVQRPLEFYDAKASPHGFVLRDRGCLNELGYSAKGQGSSHRMLEFHTAIPKA